jgi:hypothetical protein
MEKGGAEVMAMNMRRIIPKTFRHVLLEDAFYPTLPQPEPSDDGSLP